jgi:hypothetical protein
MPVLCAFLSSVCTDVFGRCSIGDMADDLAHFQVAPPSHLFASTCLFLNNTRTHTCTHTHTHTHTNSKTFPKHANTRTLFRLLLSPHTHTHTHAHTFPCFHTQTHTHTSTRTLDPDVCSLVSLYTVEDPSHTHTHTHTCTHPLSLPFYPSLTRSASYRRRSCCLLQ